MLSLWLKKTTLNKNQKYIVPRSWMHHKEKLLPPNLCTWVITFLLIFVMYNSMMLHLYLFLIEAKYIHVQPIIYLSVSYHIFSCDQAALRIVESIRPPLCLSLCHTFDNVPLIASSWNFREWLSLTKGQFHRSEVNVIDVKSLFSCSRSVTQAWIHIWWCNDAHNMVWLRRGAELEVSRWQLHFKFTDGYKKMQKLDIAPKKCPVVLQVHSSHFKLYGTKGIWLWPEFGIFRLWL